MNFFEFLLSLFFGEKQSKQQQQQKTMPQKHRPTHVEQPRQTDSDNLTNLTMKELIDTMRNETHQFMIELERYSNGNKAAGKRARQRSLSLEKLYKEFRKRSVHETPKPETTQD